MARRKGSAKYCQYCGVSFYSLSDLKKHIKVKHRNPSPETTIEPADNQPTTELPPGAQRTQNPRLN
jgi:hypothetical protein